MPDNPLNKPRDLGGIDNIIDLFNCMINGKSTIYISAPITTGHRFLVWYKQRGFQFDPESPEYKNEHFREVIQPNNEYVSKKIDDLRHRVEAANPVVINPTVFNWPEWTQDDYRYFWGKVIERYVNTVIFMNGWQYSSGCAFEFLTAVESGAQTLNENQVRLDPQNGLQLIKEAIAEYHNSPLPSIYLERVANELESLISKENQEPVKIEPDFQAFLHSISQGVTVENKADLSPASQYLKDEVLDRLAIVGNVAQFVSFEPGPESKPVQRFSRISGFNPNYQFSSPEHAIDYLLKNSPEGTVNIRSFRPGISKGEPLYYGLDRVEKVMEILYQKVSENKFTIVNETIDINDGGVSGVLMGQVLEFSPGDTPKCVEKPGVCRLPREIGLNILETVYGFRPTLNFPFSYRVEFSIHPKKRGIRHAHTIIWELEEVNVSDAVPDIYWPDNFSRLLGDKAYGLLIADVIGLPVPMTTVITRSIAPFRFGIKTGMSEIWMRTCPEFRFPGKYPTYFGWQNPFELIAEQDQLWKEDTVQPRISSILAQEAVNPEYSGSLVPGEPEGKEPLIEGVRGSGDAFMLGKAAPEELPGEVKEAIRELYHTAFNQLGPIEMEWVYDGKKAWIVQMHKTQVTSSAEIIYPGEPDTFIKFNVSTGLEALRKLISSTPAEQATGIILVGDIGITSHFGDLLRRAKIPSRIEKS